MFSEQVEVADVKPETEGARFDTVELPDAKPELEIVDEPVEPGKQEDLGETAEHKPRKGKKSYQERLDEVLYQKHTAVEEAAAARAESDVLRQEIELLKKPGASADSTGEDITRLRADRLKAAEDDDLAKAFELDDQIRDLQLQQRAEDMPATKRKVVDSSADAGPSIHPAAQAWLDANDWYGKEDAAALSNEVRYIEKQLLDEGFGYSQAMFEELDRRIQAQPEFDAVYADKKAASVDNPKPKPRVGIPSRGGEPPKSARDNELTDYDLRVMDRTRSLDRNNPVHRATYLKYKRKHA